MHWGHKAAARDQMAHDWGYAIVDAKTWSIADGWESHDPLFTGPVTCQITVYWPPRRPGMDGDNLLACFKKGIDQLQQQGIVADDRQLSFPPIIQEKDEEKIGRVVVELEGE